MAKKKRLIDYVCSEEKLSSNEEICLSFLGHARGKKIANLRYETPRSRTMRFTGGRC